MGDYITSWQRLEKGIVTGCTISVILFVMAMNFKTKADIRQPPGRGFMDDVTITTTTHIQARWVLGDMENSYMGKNEV